ncbi:MAG: peptidoglycan editing factor PgeF [Clostridia bacterium]|nr:peptidoglycan editing factor PgeF [Clostridia bacterium]
MTDSFYFDNTNGVKTLRCRALDEIGFKKHCFTTRAGGVSRGYLSETNLSFSREARENVLENYRRVFEAAGFSGSAVLSNQEHTDIVLTVDGTHKTGGFWTADRAADGFVTNERGLCLVIFVADCVPVIIADPQKKAAACVHSGWRGTALGITAAAVRKLMQNYGCDPRDMTAAVGPCIGACCYEVGQDVFDGFTARDLSLSRFFEKKTGGKYMLDLNGANRAVLESAGLLPENIHLSCECTYCNSDIYYSHRATNGKRGNMAAMVEI